MARAGIAAVELLSGSADVDSVRKALAEVESHEANVLRTVIPPFVRSILERT